MAVDRNRMMYPQKRVVEIGNRIDMGAERKCPGARLQIEALEGQDTVALAEAVGPCDTIRL